MTGYKAKLNPKGYRPRSARRPPRLSRAVLPTTCRPAASSSFDCVYDVEPHAIERFGIQGVANLRRQFDRAITLCHVRRSASYWSIALFESGPNFVDQRGVPVRSGFSKLAKCVVLAIGNCMTLKPWNDLGH